MPNFPTAGGEIPKTLNPLNLRHYFLLAYWIYFRPTALKCYLYQADPELYHTGAGFKILLTLLIPAYRNLYLTALGVSVLFLVLIALLTIGVALLFNLALDRAFNSTAQSLFNNSNLTLYLAGSTTFGLAFGSVGGIVRGVLFGVVRGVLFSVVRGVTFALAVGAYLVASGLWGNLGGLLNAAFVGLGFGLAFSAVGGVAGCMAVDVVLVMLIGVGIFSIFDSSGKVAFTVAFAVGSLRIVFYLFELGLALRSVFWNKKHPIEWDELIALPLPGTQRVLAQRLQQDELNGLRLAADVACNPFQRWAVQRTLQTYFHNHAAPLHFLYDLLANPYLNTYVCAPVSKKDWENLPTTRQLLLGELGGQWVTCRTAWADQLAERLVWSLTWFCRARRQTPLTLFASMLYQILDDNTVSAENFRLSNYQKAYADLTLYPGGEEITRSFEALATFLNYDNILSLPTAVEIVSGLTPDDTSIRPTVLTALARLGAIGAEVATYQTATSHIKQKSALARAVNSLNELDEYVVAEVTTPEQQILRQIVDRWHLLLSGNKVLKRTFPTYRGKLPQYLNPLNRRHYFLLAYWVYFRPTALNCYLYQAAPGIYHSRGVGKIFRSLGIPAYRNIYYMALPAIALFSVLVISLVVPDQLLAHSMAVNAVAVTPDNRTAISASSDGTVKMWDLNRKPTLSILANNISALFDSSSKQPENKRWQERLTWQSKAQGVTAVAVSPNKQYVVSALTNSTFFVDKLDFGGIIPYLEKHFKVRILYRNLNFSNKTQIVETGTLKVWNWDNGEEKFLFKGHREKVNAVTITPDGGKIVSASADKTLKVWDLNSAKVLLTLEGHEGHTQAVNAVAITPDGGKAVSASDDRTLKVWDLNSGEVLYTLKGHGDRVRLMAVTPDGNRAISFAATAHIPRFWDLESGVELQRANDLLDHLGLANWEYGLKGMMVISGILSVPLILTVSVATCGVAGSVIGGVIGIIVLIYASPVRYIVDPLFGVVPKPLFPVVSWVFSAYFIPCSMAGGVASRKAFGVVGSVELFAGLSAIVWGIAADAVPMTESPNWVWRVVVNVVGSVVVGLVYGAWTGVISIASASRLIFHPVYCVLALRSRFGKGKHPVEWDELVVLPLPGTQRILSQRLQRSELDGLRLVTEVAGNPFQRAFAQQALHTYLHQQVAPLRFLYDLLTNPDWQTYIYAPVRKKDWEQFPTTGQLLLGELGGQWVDCSSGKFNREAERIVWQLTQFLRNRRQTPLTRFATMLYQLLGEKTVEAENFDLSSYRRVYAELTFYPDGEEIAQSFEALADFLAYKQLSDIAKAADAVSKQVPADTAVRPTVLTALADLGAVGKEVATYQAASSRVNKLAALARALKTLDDIDNYIIAEVITPEKALLRRVIRQWRPLVTEASGKVGRAEIPGPVANPYIAGNPVTGHIFVGREDILRHLEELWMVKECPSVVLYGHRRMGKTSILRNLPTRLTSQTIVVDFNMQRLGGVKNTGELLYNLALELHYSISLVAQEQLGEPDEERFVAHNPYTAFNRFLKQLDGVRAEQRFIVAIDEFELIEQGIEENRLEPYLLDYWRSLIQTYAWFIIALAGLHTLKEMTQNYWAPLFGSVKTIPVSFLSDKAMEQLIVQPSPDFNLDYDQDAVNRIYKLTNGQPYLVQLIGHTLVTRFNRQTFEEGIERERHFTVADVETVIDAPEFYRDGNAYFNGVWEQAEDSEPAGQIAVLKALSHTGLSLTEIAKQTTLSPSQVQAALNTLHGHDVVKQEENGQYVYTVELMRRWVAQRNHSGGVEKLM